MFARLRRDLATGDAEAAARNFSRLLVMRLGSKQSITTSTLAVADFIATIAVQLIENGTWHAPRP